jgi:hypothetical protein
MDTITPFVIMSFDRPDMSDAELESRRSFGVRQLCARKLDPIPCRGVYMGQSEQAYIVPVMGGNEVIIGEVSALATAYGQDCVLAVDANGRCELIYPDGKREHIGQWAERSAHAVRDMIAYTELNGRYFVAA